MVGVADFDVLQQKSQTRPQEDIIGMTAEAWPSSSSHGAQLTATVVKWRMAFLRQNECVGN